MSEVFRGFIGLPLPDGPRKIVARTLDKLEQFAAARGMKVRWTRPEQLHITLKFLGDVPRDSAEGFARLVRHAAAGHSAVDTAIDGLGAFGPPRRARIVFAKVGEAEEKIASIAAALEEGAAAVGIERERRPFHAHVTLGRLKRPANVSAMFALIPLDRVPVRFDRIRLYESTLGEEGSRYKVLEESMLDGA
jgi:2'-5' RNA ligase